MAIVTGDRYVELLVNFVEKQAESLLEGTLILKLNPVGLHYVQSRLEALQELERLRTGAPVDYLRAYIADLGDHRALEQLRRVLRLLTSIKVVSVLPHPCRDPTPLSLLPFGRLRSLELRGCDLSTSAARGLLELRNTLEKIICHNSTDALRHIFAGRIVEIQDCPAWTRLSFVSCASNNMVLMDESLQLLPAVETLDLSRNRFAKIASLHKCMQLKYLDLGFNSIRTISSLNEVTAQITKLILRNNALTTLHGIENLTTLEGLDLSFNMISNFAEIELLSSLPVLESVWLEGNPISCARLYREQVFSFFSDPHKLKLDDKAIHGREVWTVKVIAARRQMQRPGYGFYAPAKGEIQSDVNSELRKFSEQYEANSSGDFQSKAKKRIARLASIEDPEHKSYLLSEGVEQDGSGSPVHESESQRRDATDIGENYKADALVLFDRIEFLKKEDSSAWFQELRDLLYPTNVDKEDYVQGINFNSKNRQSHTRRRRQNRVDNSSSKVKVEGKDGSTGHHDRDIPEVELQHMRDDAGDAGKIVNEVQENGSLGNFSLKGKTVSNSFVKHATPLHPWLNSGIGEINSSEGQSKVLISNAAEKLPREGMAYSFVPGTVANEEMCSGESFGSLKTIEEIIESHSSSFCLSSPPHYQEGILHRRQNLEEEFMQLSLDSYSIASSSDSESSSDDHYLSNSSSSIDRQTISHADPDTDNDNANGESNIVLEDISEVSGKRQHSSLFKDPSLNAHGCLDSNAIEDSKMEHTVLSCAGDILADADGGRLPQTVSKGMSQASKTTGTWKHKRRVVLLDEVGVFDADFEQTQDASSSLCVNSLKNGMAQLDSTQDGLDKSDGSKEIIASSFNKVKHPFTNCAETSDCNIKTSEMSVSVESDDPLKRYFHRQLADDRLSESCLYCFSCNCIRLWEDDPDEREVALLLSSENKLYILTPSGPSQSGVAFKVLGSHKLQDIKDILVGLGLQALRVRIGHAVSYLFLTRSIVKSRELFSMLEQCFLSRPGQSYDSFLHSWEQVQIKLFEKHVLGGLRLNIFLYAMLLLEKDSAWFARSLFLTADCIFLCVEDLVQFGCVSDEAVISEPYVVLDARSSISDIQELVIEPSQGGSLTLISSHVICGKFCFSTTKRVLSVNNDRETCKDSLGHVVWKLKGFTDDTLPKLVTLLRALYMAATMHPLPVKNM